MCTKKKILNEQASTRITFRRLVAPFTLLQDGIQNTGVELPFSLCGKELYFCVTFAFRCSRRRLGNCTLRNQTENSLCIQWLGWKKKDYRRAFTCISSSRKGVQSWIMYVKICIYSYATRSTDIMYTAWKLVFQTWDIL